MVLTPEQQNLLNEFEAIAVEQEVLVDPRNLAGPREKTLRVDSQKIMALRKLDERTKLGLVHKVDTAMQERNPAVKFNELAKVSAIVGAYAAFHIGEIECAAEDLPVERKYARFEEEGQKIFNKYYHLQER